MPETHLIPRATMERRSLEDSGCGLILRTLPLPKVPVMMAGVLTIVPFWGS